VPLETYKKEATLNMSDGSLSKPDPSLRFQTVLVTCRPASGRPARRQMPAREFHLICRPASGRPARRQTPAQELPTTCRPASGRPACRQTPAREIPAMCRPA